MKNKNVNLNNKKLVFLDKSDSTSEPFTTSEIVAEYADVSHHAIQQLLTKYEDDFKGLGFFAFEMRKIKSETGRGRPEKIYHLNEQQATLLITYLKNTEQVRAFKQELVKQFYAMREIIRKREAKEEAARILAHEKRKPIRRDMTDAIRDCIPESPHKNMRYKHYTDLAYQAVLGKTAAQIRKDNNLSKDANVADVLTAAENEAVSKVENRISLMIQLGLDYNSIKSVLFNKSLLTVLPVPKPKLK